LKIERYSVAVAPDTDTGRYDGDVWHDVSCEL